MHEQAIQACRLKLHAALGEVHLTGKYQGHPGITGDFQSFAKEAHKHVKRWMREFDLTRLVCDHIHSHHTAFIAPQGLRDTGTPYSLREALGATRMQSLEDGILDELDALPITYRGYILLPRFLPLGIPELQIARGVSLFERRGLDALEWLSLSNLTLPRKKNDADVENLTCTYLVVESSGRYAPNNETHTKLVARIKQVMGLSFAANIIQLEYLGRRNDADFYESRGSFGEESSHLIVKRASDGSTLDVRQMSAALHRRVNFVTFYSNRWFPPRKVGEQFDETVTAAQREAKLKEIYKPIAMCIDEEDKHSDVLAAAQWSFDSDTIHVESETYSFLYAAIGLEAVLGGPDDDVTKRLGDRLSYLVGISRDDRDEIQRKFKTFYDYRSKIAHGKSVLLNEEQGQALHWGQRILRRAIRRELELVGTKKRPWFDPTP